jgi:hypothetical protein
MATAKEFVARITEIDGVSGCVLVRGDGEVLGGNLEDPDLYTSLMTHGGASAGSIMDKAGFSYCRHLSFNRDGKEHFYLFPIGKFYLGLIQAPDCYVPDMLQAVSRLIGRVTTGSSSAGE